MSSELRILDTKTGKSIIAALIFVLGGLGIGLPINQTGSANKIENINEKVIDNQKSIAVMEQRVEGNTHTLDEIQAGVADNSEKLNQIIGQLRQRDPHDKL